MEVITPFKLQSTSEIFWSRSLAAAKSASEPGFSFLHDNQTMPALAGLQGSVIARQIQAAQVGDVDAVREVAVGGQGTKLLVLKKCSEGSIMVKKNKVLTWKERNKRFEDVDSSPDIVAIEKVRRNIHSIPYILQQQLPSIANCQLAWWGGSGSLTKNDYQSSNDLHPSALWLIPGQGICSLAPYTHYVYLPSHGPASLDVPRTCHSSYDGKCLLCHKQAAFVLADELHPQGSGQHWERSNLLLDGSGPLWWQCAGWNTVLLPIVIFQTARPAWTLMIEVATFDTRTVTASRSALASFFFFPKGRAADLVGLRTLF